MLIHECVPGGGLLTATPLDYRSGYPDRVNRPTESSQAAVFCLWSREIALGADADATPADAFLRLSTLLTGFPDVDPALATRLRAALLDMVPTTWQALARLLPIALRTPDDSTLMMTARDAGLGNAALALVTAWYTGTVGSGAHTEVVAYADALMYRTVADGLAPPTYALCGPAWWTAAPPTAGCVAASGRARTTRNPAGAERKFLVSARTGET